VNGEEQIRAESSGSEQKCAVCGLPPAGHAGAVAALDNVPHEFAATTPPRLSVAMAIALALASK